MSGLDDILRSLPMDQLAQQLGTDEATARQATSMALPALLGGLQANATDPRGAASLQDALAQHDPSLVEGGIDLQQVDPADGERISSHIFGGNKDQVVHALGGAGGANVSDSLMSRLLPLLAPIVLSYLAKQMQGGGGRSNTGGPSMPSLPTRTQQGGGSAGAPGSLQDMLGQVLGGAAGGPAAQTGRQSSTTQGSGGSILTDLLGGLLGGGRR
jgi:hypothetical protein